MINIINNNGYKLQTFCYNFNHFLNVALWIVVLEVTCIVLLINKRVFIFDSFWLNFLFFLTMQMNILLDYVNILVYANISLIYSCNLIAISMLVFTRFRQINKQFLSFASFLHFKFCQFSKIHTNTVKDVWRIDKVYGRVMFFLIINLTPVCAYISMTVFMGKISFSLLPFSSALFLGMFIVIFGLHFLTSQYSVAIHSHSKPLRHLNVNTKYRSPRDAIKVNHYIAKFSSKKRYGITYLNMGLISYSSFAKVTFGK